MNELEIIVSLLREILANCGSGSIDPSQVEALIKQYVGDKTTLTTQEKSTIVAAINELVETGGTEGSETSQQTAEEGYLVTDAEHVDYDPTITTHRVGSLGELIGNIQSSLSTLNGDE